MLWSGAQDSITEEHGHAGKATVLLLLLHHRPYHDSGLGAGAQAS